MPKELQLLLICFAVFYALTLRYVGALCKVNVSWPFALLSGAFGSCVLYYFFLSP